MASQVDTVVLAVAVPAELIEIIGSKEKAEEQARIALVIELLRDVQLSEGKAAELLGISRYEMMRLSAQHQIPVGAQTEEELLAEVEVVHRLRERNMVVGRDQR